MLVSGEKILSSSHPVLRKLNPHVAGITVDFARQ